jgi:hypothetical protein
MRKWLVRTGVVVILVWIAIQFVPVAQTNPPVEGDIPASPTVKAILESWEAVDAGDMPPWSYRALHRQARLSAQDRERLRSWTVPP